MPRKNQSPNCSQLNSFDLVQFLEILGHLPTKVIGNDHWYLSPLRNERTASFKVNQKLNRWFDHGIGVGGTVVDFGCLYFNCSVKDLLTKDFGSFSFHPQAITDSTIRSDSGKLSIIRSHVICSTRLLYYLKERRISYGSASKFCCEIEFGLRGKKYYAVGFKNDRGGYELRNVFFKGSSSPKAVTTIKTGAERLAVFEGFFDFLSFMEIGIDTLSEASDFLILNSLAFADRVLECLEDYEEINLFLDNDDAGQNSSRYLLSASNKCIDRSWLYKNHHDLNAWLVNFGKYQPPT